MRSRCRELGYNFIWLVRRASPERAHVGTDQEDIRPWGCVYLGKPRAQTREVSMFSGHPKISKEAPGGWGGVE